MSGEPHPTGLPAAPDSAHTCGACAWAVELDGALRCEAAAHLDDPGPVVRHAERACALFEPPVSCDPCGACCREAFDSVPVTREDRRRLAGHDALVREHADGWVDLARVPSPGGCGTWCAALYREGGPAGPFRCHVYAVRPDTCRDLAPGSRGCLTARRRVGLSPGTEPRRDQSR